MSVSIVRRRGLSWNWIEVYKVRPAVEDVVCLPVHGAG